MVTTLTASGTTADDNTAEAGADEPTDGSKASVAASLKETVRHLSVDSFKRRNRKQDTSEARDTVTDLPQFKGPSGMACSDFDPGPL